MMRTLLLIALAACSSPTPTPIPSTTTTPTTAAAPAGPRRWLAGDLHMHVAPPDTDGVTASIADIAHAATEAGMDFIVLTPHVWDGDWDEHRSARRKTWRAFA